MRLGLPKRIFSNISLFPMRTMKTPKTPLLPSSVNVRKRLVLILKNFGEERWDFFCQ
jgi:hypothetical protein